ncbi:hypothetical protein FRX31_033927 [Thalictrum thalictroides]|uniref:Uncharacterized protein n=1 Tax=Thalictrum thalictroides TaxID=46969 RepID=A0A7J6UV83_THATH|nr:hypothetical protein FRX31_033927 [Thalictrum thalictroides]
MELEASLNPTDRSRHPSEGHTPTPLPYKDGGGEVDGNGDSIDVSMATLASLSVLNIRLL